MSNPNFLKTKTDKKKLKAALEVIREFKDLETEDDWLFRPFVFWGALEMLEEYLAHLVDGDKLKKDTISYIKSLEKS